jgi:hypothetical protein
LRLTTVPIGASGVGVRLGVTPTNPGTLVVVKPDLAQYRVAPPDPSSQNLTPDPTTVNGEFAGSLKGNLSVSPSGAAIYTVPIDLPPGIAGMVPNLSLVYNSQSGDGSAGRGWDLAGLSTIHRCAKTRIQDGYARPVIMDQLVKTDGSDSDGICLDVSVRPTAGRRCDSTPLTFSA